MEERHGIHGLLCILTGVIRLLENRLGDRLTTTTASVDDAIALMMGAYRAILAGWQSVRQTACMMMRRDGAWQCHGVYEK
jgi:hypothetical protein